MERFRENRYKDDNGKFLNLRPAVKAQVFREQKENGRAYNSLVADNAVLAAGETFRNVCKTNKRLKEKGATSGFAELHFKSRKGSRHSFRIDRLPKCLSPCVQALGNIDLTEEVPEEAIGRACVITFDKGRWFIEVQQHIELSSEIQGDVQCVGIDPGVRTFATCFSEKEAWIAGEQVAREKLFPLMKRVDTLLSRKQKILNTQQGARWDDMPQWARDNLVYINREINRLKCKKDDLVLDLHNRLAFDLVQEYDVIFLPTFQTRDMVRRKDKKIRTIRRNTCRQMLDLNHYQFKQRLKWYARKYGKHVVDCNESYSSKNRSWDGTMDDKLGSAKVIRDNEFEVDRDINAARGILIKHLTRQLAP